ncbi:dihydroxyacetone kinase family protein [Cryobacterium serini]|uniref:Dihydroxyacetone kinase family protein n=1 Tax=Cryobacterium serini TaxID=1259201 RepID=A0A4R9BJN5_9MICO|nr:dihydroxyacetone kinase family protein [Cryobacterium serini]TFD85924.1 dihydroxyacetone kinase family protein [Cryobacterium serini]
MTRLFGDPAEFAEDQLAGFVDLYRDRLRGVPGGVVALPSGPPQVAVIVGGGSGHYPAFAGLVGPGFATGAVVGNIFTSPSAARVYSVAKAAHQGRGVVLSFGNYAGDTMNFGIAAERLRKEGIDTRIVIVTDDIASAAEEQLRRGIAGDFTVFKVMGAAAATGVNLDEVERLGRAANAATRTLGVAFSGCTMPGAHEPLFDVPAGHLGLGLGIHGEPGIRDEPMPTAADLAHTLVNSVLAEAPAHAASKRVAVILNGLGTTKYEELFLLWSHIAPLLREAGHTTVDVEVDEIVTSLDMGGCSLTLMWLDDELETHWRADAYTPGYRKQKAPLVSIDTTLEQGHSAVEVAAVAPDSSAAGRKLAGLASRGLLTMQSSLHEHEQRLGDIDAIAGDGDHGRGMVKGIDAAVAVSTTACSNAAGVAWLLQRSGQAWAEEAGGTSGVLWGAALEAAGMVLTDDRDRYLPSDIVAGAEAFLEAIVDLGGATIGDKTMVDALIPFVDELRARVATGASVQSAWRAASVVATVAAADTAALTPKLGRARPLAAKSVGTPDAGATSLALLVTALGAMSHS